ncbi:MAG: tetratricopeptide repeat protein [Lentisphaerales bacterium]|nr:tetratricopeptide repeat protein [Lentisphaerales bacterium]
MGNEMDLLRKEANELFNEGKYVEARIRYQKLNRLHPSAESENYLGLIAFYRERYQSAVKHLLRAIEQDTENNDYKINLAMVYSFCDKSNEAILILKTVLNNDSQCIKALNVLGSIYAGEGSLASAEDVYKKALWVSPQNADLHNNLGNIYKMSQNLDKAQRNYEKALSLSSQNANTLYNLGCLHLLKNEKLSAKEYFESCLEIDNNNESAKYLLSSLVGNSPSIAPQAYISELFDEFAPTFEKSLIENLEYSVPEQLFTFFMDNVPQPMVDLDYMIDIGCGTGLGAKAFSSVTKHAIGIDLSASMLKLADAKNIFDQTYRTSISEFFQLNQIKFDLFLACDVFIYVGDLENIFSETYTSAKDKAYFLFSTELLVEGEGFHLQASGRYAHSENYISVKADVSGWQVVEKKITNIRKEKGEWVKGMLFLLQKN